MRSVDDGLQATGTNQKPEQDRGLRTAPHPLFREMYPRCVYSSTLGQSGDFAWDSYPEKYFYFFRGFYVSWVYTSRQLNGG